jgi:CubicO group peptidase (beta-lactamase class C family)
MNDTDTKEVLIAERLELLRSVIAEDIRQKRYWGAVVTVARRGQIGLHAALGNADGAGTQKLTSDSVFSIFSVTKAFTNVLALKAIEDGRLSLAAKISEIIPEFSGGLRQEITVFDLMTHRSGLPMLWNVRPDQPIDRLEVLVAEVVKNIQSIEPPGGRVAYSPMFNHLLLGEVVRRLDPKGRSYRAIVQEEIFDPVGMTNSSVGLRPDLRDRHVVPDFRGNVGAVHPAHDSDDPNGAFRSSTAEMPWVGVASTVPDMHRFAEMLRNDGQANGRQILSAGTLAAARQIRTGEEPNELYRTLYYKRNWAPAPAYIGLGFSMRGTAVCHHLFGSLTSPGTFGNYGAGSALFWVDPARDLTFTFLSAGVMDSTDNIVRFERLSDIAVSAVPPGA